MDLFLQMLDPEESHYCFLQPYLLVDALRHFKLQQVPHKKYLEHLIQSNLISWGIRQVTAVIVVPIWPNSSFFNIFWPHGQHMADFVTTMIVTQPYFLCGPLVNGNGMRGRRPYVTAVLHVNFRQDAPKKLLSSSMCLQAGCEK